MLLKFSVFAEKFPLFFNAYLADVFALSGCGNNLVYYLFLLTAVQLHMWITRLIPLVTATVTICYFVVLMSVVFRKIKDFFFR